MYPGSCPGHHYSECSIGAAKLEALEPLIGSANQCLDCHFDRAKLALSSHWPGQ